MNVFVTGAGLLGLYSTRLLQRRGDRVTFYDVAPNDGYIQTVVDPASITVVRGDITNQPDLYRAVRDARPEVIFHTAALIGMRAGESMRRTFEINVEATMHVAEAAATFGVRRVVYCATNGVYDYTAPAQPEGVDEYHPVGTGSPYGNSKLAAEQLLVAAGARLGIDVISLRFCSVYGRGTFVGGSYIGQTIDDLVHAAITGEERTIVPGFNCTEYVYIKDAAEAVTSAIHVERTEHRIFNIGVGVTHTPPELVEGIRRAIPGARIGLDAAYLASPRAQARVGPYNLTRARTELGYAPRYSLEDGMRDYAREIQAGRALD